MLRKIIFSFSLAGLSLVSAATDYYIVGGENLDALNTSSISGGDGATGWSTTNGGSKTINGITEENAKYHICMDRTVRSPADVNYATPCTSEIIIEESWAWTILDKMRGKTLTLSNLVIRTGGKLVVSPVSDGPGAFTNNFAGNWNLEEGALVEVSATRIRGENNNETVKNFVLAADISGRGSIAMPSAAHQCPHSGTLSNKITGDISAFTGDIMTWNGYNAVSLELVNEKSIPGNPAEGTVSYIVVTNGATLKISQDWNSPINRVWILGDSGRPTIEVASGKTVAINSDLVGSVGFVKKGGGTLILRGESQGFSGEITVEAGFLRLSKEAIRLANAEGVSITEAGGRLECASFTVFVEPLQIVTNLEYLADADGFNPPLTVTDDDGTVLVCGTDYEVSYKNNTKAGVATVTVSGIGRYNGMKMECEFTIRTAKVVEGLYSLTRDEDWTDYEVVQLPSKGISVIDLKGHRLTISGLERRGSITDSVGGGELHYYVHDTYASGYVAKFLNTDDFVSLTGKLKLVKEGPGVLLCGKAQGYTGGTAIREGILRIGIDNGNTMNIGNPLGPNGEKAHNKVYLGPNGILDPASIAGWGYHDLTIDGGMISNTVANIQLPSIARCFNPCFTVNADFTFATTEQYGLSLGDLQGHTATVSVAPGKVLYLMSAIDPKVTGGGRINIVSGGTIGTLSNYPPDFSKIDFADCNAALDLSRAEMSVHDYAPCNTVTSGGGSAQLKVYGTFTPNSAYFYGPTMQDGSTIDLSAKTGTWNANSSLTGGNQVTKFADGAKVAIEFGGRKLKRGDKVIAWSSKPNASFASKSCIFDVRDDGLYVLSLKSGFSLIVR